MAPAARTPRMYATMIAALGQVASRPLRESAAGPQRNLSLDAVLFCKPMQCSLGATQGSVAAQATVSMRRAARVE